MTAPLPNIAEMTGPQFLDFVGKDAEKWAAAFRQTAINLGYSDMDEGWLLGWFANAIEANNWPTVAVSELAYNDDPPERVYADMGSYSFGDRPPVRLWYGEVYPAERQDECAEYVVRSAVDEIEIERNCLRAMLADAQTELAQLRSAADITVKMWEDALKRADLEIVALKEEIAKLRREE